MVSTVYGAVRRPPTTVRPEVYICEVPSLLKFPDGSSAAVQSLTADAARKVGEVALSAVDAAIEGRWTAAKQRANRLTGDSVDAKVKALSKLYAKEMGTVGAVTGAAAAVPTFGTAAALSAGAAEFSWFTVRSSELILTIAALHGHTKSTMDERRAWILSLLIFGDGASAGFTRLAGEVGKGVGKKATVKMPLAVIRGINSSLGRTIVTKYGKKRGVIAIGTAFPFGVGAVVGGTANYTGVRLLARHANKFFKNLPYETIRDDTFASD